MLDRTGDKGAVESAVEHARDQSAVVAVRRLSRTAESVDENRQAAAAGARRRSFPSSPSQRSLGLAIVAGGEHGLADNVAMRCA